MAGVKLAAREIRPGIISRAALRTRARESGAAFQHGAGEPVTKLPTSSASTNDRRAIERMALSIGATGVTFNETPLDLTRRDRGTKVSLMLARARDN